MQSLYQLVEIFVVLAVVCIFCGSMYVRLRHPRQHINHDYSHTPSVTVLMSCFNEGQAVYETITGILQSEYQGRLSVIAIDDCSKDDSWVWMQKAAEGHPNVRVLKNERNLGKPKSLLKALALADSDLILNVDSDGSLHKHAVRELASCFADPRVGAAGGSVMVRNSLTNWLTQLQTLQYNTAFQMSKITETAAGSVSCISGALFMVRREIYERLRRTIQGRNWLGFEVKDGEDRYMTNLIINLGYRTIVNKRAKVYTDVPATFKAFFSQQIRWRRGFVRMMLWSLEWPNFRKKIQSTSAFSIFRFYTICILLFVVPGLITWVLITQGIFMLVFMKLQAVILMSIIHGVNYIIARRTGNDIVIGPIAFIVAPMWMLVDLTLITALALFTLTSVSWETRILGTDTPNGS